MRQRYLSPAIVITDDVARVQKNARTHSCARKQTQSVSPLRPCTQASVQRGLAKIKP